MALGPLPTEIGRTTLFELGLICDTVASVALLTQTAPSPAATPLGVPLTGIVATTLPVPGSILDTELSRLLATHTAPAPRAIPVGPLPTGTVLTTVLVAGLIHDTDRSPLLVTQTAPSPAATPAGSRPTVIGCTTRRVAASTLEMDPCSALVTHTAPSPAATCPDRASSGICPTNVFDLRSISPRLLAAIVATPEPRSVIRSATSAVATSTATRTPAMASRRLDRRRPAGTTLRSPPDSRRSAIWSATCVRTSRRWLWLPAVWLGVFSTPPAATWDACSASYRLRT